MPCAATDDNMIVERDADKIPRFNEALGFGQVFVAGCCISARMCVCYNYGCRAKAYRLTENISGMKRRSIKNSSEYQYRFAQKAPLGVEIERKHVFLLLVDSD